MTLKIGNAIKELRNQHNVTQDKLAEYLGVTAQAVSRWENGAGYPDIELLPAIAAFFGITLDVLMGVDLSKAQQDRIFWRLIKLNKEGDRETCIKEGNEALKRFPSNHCFVVLTASAEMDLYQIDHLVDKEKRDAVFEKWLPWLKRTVEDCTDWGPLNAAKRLLIRIYQTQNRDDEAAKIAEGLISITCSQEWNLPGCLYDDARIEFIQNRLPLIAAFLVNVLAKLDHPEKDDKPSESRLTRKECKRMISLWDILYDSDNAPDKMENMSYILLLFRYAFVCYKENDDESAMKYLHIVSEGTVSLDTSEEDLFDSCGNNSTKASLAQDPNCQLPLEELQAHNFSYMIYHGYLKGDMFSRISKDKEYLEICKALLANAK